MNKLEAVQARAAIAALLIALWRMVGLRNCLELVKKLPHQAGSNVTWLAPLLLLA
jgi:hypothetical protein